MKRLKNGYSDDGVHNDDLYAEIQARRDERAGQEGANLFEGITSKTPKAELIAALEADDKKSDSPNSNAPSSGLPESDEKAGVGTANAPRNQHVPDSVLIPVPAAVDETGSKITPTASVIGNKNLMIIDNLMSRPVKVHLLESKTLDPDAEDGLVYVEGPVSNDLCTYAAARAKFAIKKDGTVIYNARGFDDVPKGTDFDLVDIVKLVQYNHDNPVEDTE